jgi:hypothetical protein
MAQEYEWAMRSLMHTNPEPLDPYMVWPPMASTSSVCAHTPSRSVSGCTR